MLVFCAFTKKVWICATNNEIYNIMQHFFYINLRFYETNNYQTRVSVCIFQTNMQMLKVPSLVYNTSS